MPRKGRGTKFNRGWGKPSKGGAAAGPSSAQNPSASGDHPGSSQAQTSVRATPAFLAPPRRALPSTHFKKAINPQQEAEMRRIFRSGADQVLARPPPKLNVTVHISWPGPLHGFKDIDPADIDVQTLLARIGKENDAKIEAEDLDTSVCITVMATNRAKAQEIIAILYKVFQYRPGEESVWRSRLLVNPPKNGTNVLTTVLQPKEGSTGRRATATTQNLGTVDEAGLIATKAAYKQSLVKVFDDIASHLRHEPNGMRMRVHFGTLVLDEWHKDKAEYAFAELESLVSRAGMRGTAHLLNTVSPSAAKALADQFSRSNMELPELVRGYLKDGDEDGDPQVTYSLILATKNIHVESKFEDIIGQKQRQGHGVQYNLGSLGTQQMEKHHRSAEVITVCPESHYDWGLEVRKTAADQATKISAPFDNNLLQKHVNFTGERLAVGFPNFKIADGFLRAHDIQNVHGKTTLQWRLGMYLTLEVNLFYGLGQNKALAARPTTATVTLLGSDWDYDMLSGVSVPRRWNESFAQQFLKLGTKDTTPGGETTEPMDHFLSWVNWIQKVLDSA